MDAYLRFQRLIRWMGYGFLWCCVGSIAAWAQCLTPSTGLFPTTVFEPACNATNEQITTCGFAGEYSHVYVVTGTTYTFSSSVNTDVITIANNVGTAAFATGTGSATWTATVTGVVRFYTHLSSCGTEVTCRSKFVRCFMPSPCTIATGQFPSITFTPTCTGNPATVVSCGFAGEYSMVNVTSGTTYTFASSIVTDVITITGSAGVVVHFVETGSGSWISTVTGSVRFYTHLAGCGTASVCRIRSVQCSPAACLTAAHGPFPSLAFTPTCTGSPQTITGVGFASDYSLVNVIAGNTYTFSSSIATDVITVGNSGGTFSYAAGIGSVTWMADLTGMVRFYTHLAGCGEATVSRTRSVACDDRCLAAVAFPSSAINATCIGTPQTITSCNFAGDYATITIPTSGITYTFSSSIATDYLVLTNTGNTWAASGTTPLVVDLPAGTYRLHIFTNSDCGLNTTGVCRATTVNCCTPSVAATDIAGPDEFCAGESGTYTVVGGSLGNDANWKWFAGTCDGSPVASGPTANLAPTVTTTYYVRAQGGCWAPTSCASITVTVNKKPKITQVTQTCSGGLGTVQVTAKSKPESNGLKYSIDGGATYQNSKNFFNVPSGTYTIVVKDKVTGCTKATSLTFSCAVAKTEAELLLTELQVSPNPLVSETKVSFGLAATANVQVSVYSLSGQEVANLFSGEVEGGQHQDLFFDGEDLPNGVYLLRLATDQGEVQTKQLVIAR